MQAQTIEEHVRNKYAGRTCGGESGMLSHFHQLRVNVVKDMLREHVWKKDTGAKVLDIGCNDGTISSQLLGLGVKVCGLDLSEESARMAVEKGIDARVGNAREKLPYEDGGFDAVFAGEIIEHLYDPEAFMRDVRRILKPGGAVVLTTPNLASLGNRMRLLFGRYPKLMSPYLSEGMGDHIHMFTVETLERLFVKTGFFQNDIASSSISLSREGFGPPYFPLLAGLCPSFGDLLISKGQKI
ncbi:MAG: class I SAM-dependent methyltransferase [Candidatus Wallbacteria bacterium]|nr:class I SAM-dependent methyltransferase [Candidatus Wallbacteria bacterium]